MATQQRQVRVQMVADDGDGWFSWRRIQRAFWRDDTAPVEGLVGVFFFALLGTLMLLGLTAFPPHDVRFLLRQARITEGVLAWGLLILGLVQTLAIGTPSRELRAWTAIAKMAVCWFVALAYLWVDAAPYFLAWASFMGLGAIEGWLALRNWREKSREGKQQAVARRLVRDIDADS